MTQTVLRILVETWNVVTVMAPYLLLGFLCAGLLSVLLSPEMVERHLGGRGLWPVVKSSFLGVPLPLCSCGVIPVAVSLRRHGASRGATIAFLTSTPQTGIDSILVTYSLLGPFLAVFRPVLAFATGVVGGGLVEAFDRGEPKPPAPEPAVCDCGCGEGGESCECESCAPGRRHGAVHRALHYGLVALPRDLGKDLAVGLVLAGLVGALVPKDFFSQTIGTGFAAMLVMMAVGIPLYVCATASVPLAAAFMAKGVSPGAALVFLLTGPATNMATIVTIWRVMGRRAGAIYLLTVAVSALLAGLAVDYVFDVAPAVAEQAHEAAGAPGVVAHLWGIALVLVLANAVVGPRLRRAPAPAAAAAAAEGEGEPGGGEVLRLRIDGMTCEHCAGLVSEALGACAGVTDVRVELDAGTATVRGAGLDPVRLCELVEAVGYEAEVAPAGPA